MSSKKNSRNNLEKPENSQIDNNLTNGDGSEDAKSCHLDDEHFSEVSLDISERNHKFVEDSNEIVVQRTDPDKSGEVLSNIEHWLATGSCCHTGIIDAIFQVLVGGPFDLESKFIIENGDNIEKMLHLLDKCPPTLQAEIWGIFVAIVRKSNQNLETCSRISMIGRILDRLPQEDIVISDLLIELLGVLSNYSITVKETKRFLKALRAVDGVLPRNSGKKLLDLMVQMPKREGPSVFFSFPGLANAGLALPPLAKWPYQNGWTFCTWLRIDPINSGRFEEEMPFLYCFRTNKGLGYSCHLMGNCLVVTSLKQRSGHGFTQCAKHELTPRRWHHVALAHVYSRWGRNLVQCYVDGQLVDVLDMAWSVSVTELWDRCFIGCSPKGDPDSSFRGQMAALYVFSESLSSQQIASLHRLGPAYQSQFKYQSEAGQLSEADKMHLFDGRLTSCLVIAYCPNNCDRQLCLESSPKGSKLDYFMQIPHAVMRQGVHVVATKSLQSSLHSVGGIRMLLPLFTQIDCPQWGDGQIVDYDICSTLLSVIAVLLDTCPRAQQQFLQDKGFMTIAHTLHKASKRHLHSGTLSALFHLSSVLVHHSNWPLLIQLFDHLLFSPELWIHAPSSLQLRLYNHLTGDLLVDQEFIKATHRTSIVIRLLQAVKYYYWLVDPRARSGFEPRGLDCIRPSREDVQLIRNILLTCVEHLLRLNGDDEEWRALLSLMASVREDDHLHDVLSMAVRLMDTEPALMVPAFDRVHGEAIVFQLLVSPNRKVRLPALKLLGFFLQRSTAKRKSDVLTHYNLLALLTERLLIGATHLSLATYNVLFELLIEQMTPTNCYETHPPVVRDMRIENSAMLKVISNLITQSRVCDEVKQVRQLFLGDLIALCEDSRENRSAPTLPSITPCMHRTVLQLSVWQEWLMSLASLHPEQQHQPQCTSLVARLFDMLLHHAVRWEFGGWRVWVDTLAIVHSQVSWRQFHRDRETEPGEQTTLAVGGDDLVDQVVHETVARLVAHTVGFDDQSSGPSVDECDQPSRLYRTPEFLWSAFHLRLLTNLLTCIENDVSQWKQDVGGSLEEHVNHGDNHVFVSNTVHILSQLGDRLVMAAGGLLPLLAAATSPKNRLDFADPNQHTLDPDEAGRLLHRFAPLVDIFVLGSALNFADVEQEKNMPTGGVLRQTLRLVATLAVRHILDRGSDCSCGSSDSSGDSLLSENDLNRLRAVVYRDMEETRQSQFLALAVTYLLSVLMVSRYRDLLEPASLDSINGSAEVHCARLEPAGPVEMKAVNERRTELMERLQTALETTAPLLRDLVCDFRTFMQKTLLGTHGQEIMNDSKVMQTLQNRQGSSIELVMLLCSQEWQTSLQKHAGLAFIELVNEGRLMSHATRDHVLRVANEADFILTRLRADDVLKHAQFQARCADTLHRLKCEESTSAQLLLSARRRHSLVATRLLDNTVALLSAPGGPWWSADMRQTRVAHWRLDSWEDDSRRRTRFVPDINGSSHREATWAMLQKAEDDRKEQQQEEGQRVLLEHLAIGALNGNEPDECVVAEGDSSCTGDDDSMTPAGPVVTFSAPARLIAPGVVVPGAVSITGVDLYFNCDDDDSLFSNIDPKVLRYCDHLHGRWNLDEIRAIFLRRYLLQNTALELFLASRTAIMFAFADQTTVRKVVQHLPKVGVGVKYGLPQTRKTSLLSPRQLFRQSDMSQKWQHREISNFDYLMFLNTIAGRTFNDLNQYPVFPWILTNYHGDTLDLTVASNFRDLSKPVGALSSRREQYFQSRYSSWEHDTIPVFHYGTHYSTSAFTLNWLIRIEPFTSIFLDFQGGKFDHPNRIFHSMAESWASCQRDSHDVKELIPELFYMPEMFRNINDYQLGQRDDGVVIGNVHLPPWANGRAEDFVMLHRQALESDLVSCQLNHWVDLVFGFKQRGPEAVRATNVFYYLTYEGALQLNAIDDPSVRVALEHQLKAFGQTPAQVSVQPHPPRQSVMTISPLMFQPPPDDLCMLMKYISNSPIVHLTANTFPQLAQPTIVSVAQNLGFALNRWNVKYDVCSPSTGQNGSTVHLGLPMTVDPLLAAGNPTQPLARRHLGDPFDQRLSVGGANFVVTTDSRYLIACGYPDYSFRVIDTDSARVRQVIFGHSGVVTCLARSEATLLSNCYVTSASSDCTVLLWQWNTFTHRIVDNSSEWRVPPTPKALLTGHDVEVTSLSVSAEQGLVVSASKDGLVLLHDTGGTLLRRFGDATDRQELTPTLAFVSRQCHLLVVHGQRTVIVTTTGGQQLSRFESPVDIHCAVLSRDGEHVLLGDQTGVVSILRVFSLVLLHSFPPCDCPIRALTLATNQRFVFVGLQSGAIVVFNVNFNRWHFEHGRKRAQS